MQKPRAMATFIGSVPHDNPAPALDRILACAPEAPIWPQLPKRSWREGFLPQYSEAVPGVLMGEDRKLRIDTKADLADEMTAFYEAAMSAPETGDYSYFAISPEHSAGIDAAIERFRALERKPPFVKVHSTGPISYALTVFDTNDTPIYFDDTFADVAVQSAAMKSCWQIERFKPFGEQVICFLDEPTLSAFGSSAYINVTREDVVARLGQAIDIIHQTGALVGVHVCGNTEWPIIIDAGADIINFDAFYYGKSMALYADAVRPFLENGGVIAWGVVPTNPDINKVSAADLEERLIEGVQNLAARGVDERLIWEQSMLTPSCGMGSLSVDEAELVMLRLKELAERVQARVRR